MRGPRRMTASEVAAHFYAAPPWPSPFEARAAKEKPREHLRVTEISRCSRQACLDQLGETSLELRPLASLFRLHEIACVRRGLVLASGHQVAVRTQEVVLAADDNMHIAFSAVVFAPTHLAGAAEVLRDGPWTG